MIHQKRDLSKEVAPVIKQAGALILSYFNTQLTRTEKVDHGFVTQADLASEKYIIENLKTIIPEANFFAEESGKQSDQQSDYCWVIDPLDGTTNFTHGLPYFCISIGLTYKNVPVFGMIYQPITDELFWATQGKGAYLNGKKIQASMAPLEKSLIAVGLPYAKDQACAHIIDSTWPIAQAAYTIRTFGAVALDIAYVAAGKIEGAVFEELGWWDVAAGMVLVQEAGGQSTDFNNKQIGPNYRSFIATGNPEIHQKLLILLKYKV